MGQCTMKTFVLTAALCALLSSTASAVILDVVVAPKDDPEVRRTLVGWGTATTNPLNRCVNLRPHAEEYNRFIETRLLPLRLADATAFFGPAVATSSKSFTRGYKLPDDLAAPVFAPSMFMRSGLGPSNPTDDWCSLTLNLESPKGKQTLYKSVDRTNRVNGFQVGGEFFQMTPKLKK